ncbi:hypothetical protein RHMOL_Rhmol11G0110800 [Rhododendron molle]|uniref:Uncharacterized protein n=1 Tax=Rhododendron molle TaxID=49168 RepID=A0ACC0LSG3_RHOML|nr:hypothetical protein RHMOL_Rhmol11G0110800 [Rhododendron molle]
MQIWVPTNPGGTERLALGIIVFESDFYLHSLWGLPNELSQNFTILLFHYDGWTNKLALLLNTLSIFLFKVCPPEKPKRDGALIHPCHHVQHLLKSWHLCFLETHGAVFGI